MREIDMNEVGEALKNLLNEDAPVDEDIGIVDEAGQLVGMMEKFVKCRNRYVSVAGDLMLDEGALFLENIRSIFDSDQVVFCYRE